MIQKLKHTMTLLAVFGFASTSNFALAQDKTAASHTSAISLVEVQAHQIAFVEHIGPYWTLGTAIDKAQSHINSVHHGSPLFLRYKTNPGKTLPQKLQVEVGFVLANGDKPHLPFLIRTVPTATSITWVISEPTISPRVAYTQLQQWAAMHDLTPVGSMIELHITNDSHGSKAPVTTIKFQMPLVSTGSTALAAESKTKPIANPRKISSAKAVVKDPPIESMDIEVPAKLESNVRVDEPRISPTLPNPEQAKPAVPQIDADNSKSLPDEVDPIAPTARTIERDKTPDTARAKTRGSGEQIGGQTEEQPGVNKEHTLAEPSKPLIEAPTETPAEASDKSDQSIESMFASGDYDLLAQQLMSSRNAKSNATIIWLGQLSFRISAAAKGIQDQYPNDAEPLLKLSHALRNQHSKLADTRSLDTLKHATVQVESSSKTTRTKLAQIMRQADRLLASIAFKQLSPDDTNSEVVSLLTQATELFNATAQ